MNIQELISSCKKKNPSAQRELVEIFSNRMLNIAKRYLVDDHLAYDALQESWILIFDKINSYKEELGTFDQWAYKIVINQSLKEIRKRNSRTSYVSEFIQEPKDEIPEVFSLLETEQIFKLIEELPNGCREIFNLFVIEEYSHKEIGKLLDISEGTSRSQLSRAKQLLISKVSNLNVIKAKAI